MPLTLKVADLDDDTPAFRDAIGTWLLGHTERIAFGRPYLEGRVVLVDATVHVPCKYLRDRRTGEPANGRTDGPVDSRSGGPAGRRTDGASEVRCAAHGYTGRVPVPRHERTTLRHDDDRFTVMQSGRVRVVDLPPKTPGHRGLPVIHHGANPCAEARCRTADNTVGAACCRDLTIDVVAPLGDDQTEALLKSRRSPYLCKATRADESIIEVEVISACGYLEPDGVHCGLHGRVRPDGRPAKPGVCSEWPDIDEDEFTGHPGCVFL